ncbi:MAG TPA: HYR domain-containing protein [Pyrinomonadaceae bacterium]|nr:HYR domain-containing protein [Pyrinomonadaceae bacterium]
MEDNQRLVGQGTGLDAALAGFGIVAPPHSDARPAATGAPTLANAGGDVIALANSNHVSFLNASAASPGAAAISSNGAGGSTTVDNVGASASGSSNGFSLVNHAGVLSVTSSSVSANSTGTGVLVNGGATAITFTDSTVSQNTGRVVDIQNRTGGAVSFNGSSTVTGTNGATDAVVLLGNTGGSTVNFAAAVQLNTTAPGARGLVADSTGGFTLNMTGGGSAVSSTGGAAVDIEDIAANVQIATTFSTDSNQNGVRVNNISGSASFGNTTVNNSSATGVSLTGNSASLTFSDLDIAPAANQRALHATSNTGAITSSSGTVSTTGAIAVEVQGTSAANRTPLNVQLTSVSANGGPNGIVLQNTSASGSPGGFRVNGIAGNCSPADPTCTGGRITATTGADNTDSGIGVRLQDAASVSLTRMRIDNHPNFAVSGTNVNGFTLDSSLVDGTNGGNAAFDEGSLRFRELTGSAAISNSFVGGGHEFIVDLRNTGSSSLDRLTISGSTIGDLDGAGPGFGVSALAGDDGLHFEHATGGGTFKVTVTGSTLNSGRGDIVNFNTAGTVTSDFVFRSNVTHNTHPAILAGGGGVTVTGGGIGSNINATYDISCNSFRGARGFGLLVAKTLGAGTMRGTLFGNVFGVDGTPGSASTEASGINLDTRGAGTHTALVKNNVVNEWGSNGAIQVFNNQGSATMNVTLQGNVTNNPDPNLAFAALYAEVGALSGDTGTLNILVGGAGAAENNFVEGDPFDFSDVFLSRIAGAGTTLNLSRGVSAASNVQQIITDNNADPVFAADSGTINFVNTVPALPPAVDQTCSAPLASNAPVDSIFQTNAHATQTASATEPGFSADREFTASSKKVQRGFANSERGQLLGAGERETLPEVETPKTVRAAAPVTATLAGETVTIPIGTLRAGDSVTITFQVTVADPFTGAQPQVSNQGTVSADGGISVLTDDPSEPGAADPTVTPILLPPTININDATVTEPATGSASASFTVTLSHPFTQPVTVSFTTANGGANPATAGTDYTPTNGTVTFNAGETVQTVNVAALADGDAGEADETFLVNLSGATNGTIGDGQAVGTITDESVASAVIISELRTSGPAGSGDDFVELLNTTDADITVASSDASGGWSIVKSGAGCSTTPVVVGFIPNGTVIRARGNYLLTGSAYSLGGYATGDATLSADIEDDRNVGLFTTATLANVSSVNRLDAVGFGANTGDNCELLREGNNLPAAMGSTSEYSFVRKVTLGLTHDTGDNAADFTVVSTTPSMPVGDNSAPTLGAPGPENGASPTGPVPCAVPSSTPLFGRALVDPTVAVASAPNTVRDATPVTNGTNGTLDFRRTFTNNTGGSVTRLRFRVVNLSTFPAGTGAADLRALTSGSTVVSTAGGPVTVQGTTLETPPAQASGGGVNSSLAAGTITLGSPLANGASVSLRFLFGVEQVGDYNLAFVLEALPGPTGKDFWKLSGHTETGGHTDGGCNAPPVADAGLDQALECAGATTPVTLDGSGSSDPDGDTPLTFDWSEGMTSLGSGETLNVNLASGSHTITLTVTDPSGASAQDTVVVNIIDTTAPVVNDPPDVTVSTGANASSCGAFVSDAALGTATATDGCEGALAVNRTGVPAGNIFPVGTTIVTYTATDAAGNVGSATQAVTVIDNTPPVVTPPANVVATADADSCSATLNPGTASVMDNCPGATVVGTRSDNQPLNAPYPVGMTTITWTGTDASGNTASATQTVTVQDNQTPTVTASVAVTTMGPPFNHAMINVGLAASASDNCPGLGPLQVSVFSDEDDGPGPHSPDALDLGLGTLKLRRERDGGSNGRVYLVVVKATDASGNTAASCQTVTVPLSNSTGDKAAVASQASAAAAFCSANNGAAPSGYFVVGP